MSATPPVYQLQDLALEQLTGLSSIEGAKLCGGTALARCYLQHRVSYDLDFFLPAPFGPVGFAQQLKMAGIKATAVEIVVDDRRANQWHGFVAIDGEQLKLSVVEDAYFDLYPARQVAIGENTVCTEAIEGLYHRKLLTVSHAGGDGRTATGGRQTARDLFDLWVLSQAVAPLAQFVEMVPYDYPLPAFEDGLSNMPWFELINEFGQIRACAPWQHGTDMELVRKHLFSEIGVDVDAEMEQAAKANAALKGARP